MSKKFSNKNDLGDQGDMLFMTMTEMSFDEEVRTNEGDPQWTMPVKQEEVGHNNSRSRRRRG